MSTCDITTPISETQATGVDVRLDKKSNALYRAMKDARVDARDAERRYYQQDDNDQSLVHWKRVDALGRELLNDYTKDIEVMAWRIEALLRINGFEGLAQGFDDVTAAVHTFGDALYPLNDPEEESFWRLQALTGLNGDEVEGSLIVPISNVSLSPDEHRPLWRYIQEQESAEDIASDALLQLHQTLKKAMASFENMMEALDGCFESDAPPSSHIKKALSSYDQQLSGLLSMRHVNSPSSETATVTDGVKPVASAVHSTLSRQQALEQIKVVADYFSKTEPHSPVPYLLERCIAWANMALPELLAEMINNGSELQQVYSLTGIKPAES